MGTQRAIPSGLETTVKAVRVMTLMVGTLARSIPVQQHSQSQFAIPAGLETAVEFVGTQTLMLQVGTLTDPIPVRPINEIPA